MARGAAAVATVASFIAATRVCVCAVPDAVVKKGPSRRDTFCFLLKPQYSFDCLIDSRAIDPCKLQYEQQAGPEEPRRFTDSLMNHRWYRMFNH